MQNDSLVIKSSTVSAVVNSLTEEQSLVGRFPCRFIFVNSIAQYRELVTLLRSRADKTLFLSSEQYCHGEDVVPKLDEVTNEIASSKDTAFVLEPFGEYLRLAENNTGFAQKVKSLLTIQCSSRTRVWIPVFCGKSILFSIVGQLNFRYDNAFYEVENENISQFLLNVCSPNIKSVGKSVFTGIKNWFQAWEALTVESGSTLLTRHASLFSPADGFFSVNVIKDPFTFIQARINDAGSLNKAMGSDAQWGWLAGEINATTTTVDALIKKALNVLSFNPMDILARWNDNVIDDNSKWLFWLWYHKGTISGGDYLSYAISSAETVDFIPRRIEVAILDEEMRNNLDDAQEQRKNALWFFREEKRSKEFWEKFAAISDDYRKIKILTDFTQKERVEIIKIAGSLLRNMTNHAMMLDVIKKVYPVLAIYLECTKLSEYSEFSAYFDKYRLLKIQDIFDSDIDTLFSKSSLLSVVSRHQLLKNIRKRNEYTLIVDGLGIEWIDLLLYFVKQKAPYVKCDINIGTVNIPSTTKANHFWDDWDASTYKKDDHLDAKSHIKDKSDGVDPFALTELQFTIIKNLATEIAEQMECRNHLIVTADHGLSRMAAIHFRQLNATLPPSGAEVKDFGRYCVIPAKYNNANPNCYKDGNILAMVTHDHFSFSGNLSGETHGGMTPEEYLVPVLLFSRNDSGILGQTSSGQLPPEVKLVDDKITLPVGGGASFIIESSEDLKSLKGKIAAEIVEGSMLTKRKWRLTFNSLRSGNTYTLSVFPNNNAGFCKNFNVEILRKGLVVEDDF